MANGKFIVLEGLDRSGKSTQCALLAERLRSEGHEILEMKFPDRTTDIGKMINAYLTNPENELSDEAIHLLFSANRWELTHRILNSLREGKTLIVDRYMYSGVAFSSAKGLDFDWCKAPDVGLPKPDLVIFLDVNEATATKRGGYGDERYEKKELQIKVREQFEKLREPSWSWLSANGKVEEVSRSIYETVKPLLS